MWTVESTLIPHLILLRAAVALQGDMLPVVQLMDLPQQDVVCVLIIMYSSPHHAQVYSILLI